MNLWATDEERETIEQMALRKGETVAGMLLRLALDPPAKPSPYSWYGKPSGGSR